MSADVSRLLARGGRVLGLAALAHARGQRAGAGPWFVLSPQLVSAAEQILTELESGPDLDALTAAVAAALGPGPATAAPSWIGPALGSPERLATVGRGIDDDDIAAALPVDAAPGDLDARTRGLAAIAVALGRSIDAIEAVGRELEPGDGRALTRMARLACVEVSPGQPTRVRRVIRRLLGEGES